MEVGSGLSAGWSDDFTSSHSYSLTIVNANGSDSWTWDEDAAWFASDFFDLEAPVPTGIMSNPLLADVDLLFGRILEGTGFLKYANTARKLLGDIPLSQRTAERMGGANPSGDLSGKDSARLSNDPPEEKIERDPKYDTVEIDPNTMPEDVRMVQTRAEFEELQRRLGTHDIVRRRWQFGFWYAATIIRARGRARQRRGTPWSGV